jgi:hypothetical protein
MKPADATTANLIKAGVPHSAAHVLDQSDLSIIDILTLVINFLTQYGPTLWAIIAAIIPLLKKPGGITEADILALAKQYGAGVYALIQAIAAMLGITLPLLPKPA